MAATISDCCCCCRVSSRPGGCAASSLFGRVLPSRSLALRTSSSICCGDRAKRFSSNTVASPHRPGERWVGKKSCSQPQAALCRLLLLLTLWLILLPAVLHGQVYRFCTPEGTWLLKENSTLPWRNLSECEASDQVRVSVSYSAVVV